jgi:hypothetical protein
MAKVMGAVYVANTPKVEHNISQFVGFEKSSETL